jgi:hypothetical protein
MNEENDSQRFAVLADVEQLYGWATRGLVVSGLNGAGYNNGVLIPRKISYLILPVAVDAHFPADMKTKNFPILIEIKSGDLANRCILSMADVLAIHFRSKKELDQYLVSSTPQFGMTEVELLESPDLFDSGFDNGSVKTTQQEFDQNLYDQLEARASVGLLLRLATNTQEGIEFLKSAIGGAAEVTDEPLVSLSSALNNSGVQSQSDLFSLSLCLLEVMSKEVLLSTSDTSVESSIAVLNKATDAVNRLNFSNSDFAAKALLRLENQRDIIASRKVLGPLNDGATPDLELMYGFLIALIRPKVSDFQFWIEKESSTVNARLVAAVFIGLRNHRWRILERKIRTPSEEVLLSQAISSSMSIGLNVLQLSSEFLPRIDEPSVGPELALVEEYSVSGRGIKQIIQTINADGTFTLRITAESVEKQIQSESLKSENEKLTRLRKKPVKSINPTVPRKPLGSAMKNVQNELFSDPKD